MVTTQQLSSYSARTSSTVHCKNLANFIDSIVSIRFVQNGTKSTIVLVVDGSRCLHGGKEQYKLLHFEAQFIGSDRYVFRSACANIATQGLLTGPGFALFYQRRGNSDSFRFQLGGDFSLVQNSVDFVNFGTLGGTRLFTRL
jgi:hypothetical protein